MQLTDGAWEAIKEFAARHDVTVSAFLEALGRHIGRGDLGSGLEDVAREAAEIQRGRASRNPWA